MTFRVTLAVGVSRPVSAAVMPWASEVARAKAAEPRNGRLDSARVEALYRLFAFAKFLLPLTLFDPTEDETFFASLKDRLLNKGWRRVDDLTIPPLTQLLIEREAHRAPRGHDDIVARETHNGTRASAGTSEEEVDKGSLGPASGDSDSRIFIDIETLVIGCPSSHHAFQLQLTGLVRAVVI